MALVFQSVIPTKKNCSVLLVSMWWMIGVDLSVIAIYRVHIEMHVSLICVYLKSSLPLWFNYRTLSFYVYFVYLSICSACPIETNT
jgi:hypothetical protein